MAAVESGAEPAAREPRGAVPTPSLSVLDGLVLSRALLDRQAERRGDAEWLEGAWSAEGARVLPVGEMRAPVRDIGDGAIRLDYASPREIGANTPRLFLGTDSAGRPHFAVPTAPEPHWRSLREVGEHLDDLDAGALVTAVALDNWHAAAAMCSRCGAPTAPRDAGWARRCTRDGAESYPRTDPAVIVLVVDAQDRALLGRQAAWGPGRFSTLAGFVEAGESAEAAVVREIREEAGIEIGETRYLGSQPWPFPGSLMLGYRAFARTTDVRVDGSEIVEARWFSRDDLLAECTEGTVALPPGVSIARRLIEHWFGAGLPGDWMRR